MFMPCAHAWFGNILNPGYLRGLRHAALRQPISTSRIVLILHSSRIVGIGAPVQCVHKLALAERDVDALRLPEVERLSPARWIGAARFCVQRVDEVVDAGPLRVIREESLLPCGESEVVDRTPAPAQQARKAPLIVACVARNVAAIVSDAALRPHPRGQRLRRLLLPRGDNLGRSLARAGFIHVEPRRRFAEIACRRGAAHDLLRAFAGCIVDESRALSGRAQRVHDARTLFL